MIKKKRKSLLHIQLWIAVENCLRGGGLNTYKEKGVNKKKI